MSTASAAPVPAPIPAPLAPPLTAPKRRASSGADHHGVQIGRVRIVVRESARAFHFIRVQMRRQSCAAVRVQANLDRRPGEVLLRGRNARAALPPPRGRVFAFAGGISRPSPERQSSTSVRNVTICPCFELTVESVVSRATGIGLFAGMATCAGNSGREDAGIGAALRASIDLVCALAVAAMKIRENKMSAAGHASRARKCEWHFRARRKTRWRVAFVKS